MFTHLDFAVKVCKYVYTDVCISVRVSYVCTCKVYAYVHVYMHVCIHCAYLFVLCTFFLCSSTCTNGRAPVWPEKSWGRYEMEQVEDLGYTQDQVH
jgi:hypothetical protein